jgi:hypothetical protein
MKTFRVVLALLFISAAALTGQTAAPSESENAEAAYTRAINERADKIVATLGISDTGTATRVRDTIAQQYRALRDLHDARDKAVAAAKDTGAEAVASARNEANAKVKELHDAYIARLSRDLSPEQVDKVKDGMTYGVLHVTYNAYTKMFPELTSEQKDQIRAWLVEAREIAMDGGSSQEKHAVFGKYKGKINNYLSAAGYNLKKGEENLRK